jgi:hypothetical protein
MGHPISSLVLGARLDQVKVGRAAQFCKTARLEFTLADNAER